MSSDDNNKDKNKWYSKLLSKKSDKEKQKVKNNQKQLFSLSTPFDEKTADDVLLYLSGGSDIEEYFKILKSFDQSPVCGLVWNANFFAYRCRDCSISPCMSICADCFLQGNHEGHDFNMFKSQAGGACDCGDETVMKAEGFCCKHGKTIESTKKVDIPEDLTVTAKIILPQLVHYLYGKMKSHLATESGGVMNIMVPLASVLKVLDQVTDIDFLRNIICETIMSSVADSQLMSYNRQDMEITNLVSCKTANGNKIVRTAIETAGTSSDTTFAEPVSFSLGEPNKQFHDSSEKIEVKRMTYLAFFMDILVKAEFPNKLSTFLLELLPNVEYKEVFTRLFCRQYTAIGNSIITSLNPDALSNHMVHVSVQLFSNETLALKMVKEENLLSKMIFVLDKMVRECFEDVIVEFEDYERTITVVDCDKKILSSHCFWPFASDFTNILSHASVAKLFLENEDMLKKWMCVVKSLTGININTRRFLTHLEYESRTYYTAFSVEFESVAAVMWELYRSIMKMNDRNQTLRMIQITTGLFHYDLSNLFNRKLRKSCFTIHLSLLRYLALFLSQGVNHFKMDLREIFDTRIIPICLPYMINAVASLQEIRLGFWVYNGHQIRCQAQSYLQSYFCNSMLDLDLFFLQLTASVVDEDEFINMLFDRFSIRSWFQFGEARDISSNQKEEEGKLLLLVEGFLNMVLMILTHRVYSGASETDMLRKDVIASLCVADRTHSQLVDCIPSRPGDSHTPSKDGSIPGSKFDTILKEVADYKAPVVESSNFQQGKYTPKDSTWRNEYDFDHIQLRIYKKSDHQAAQERYNAFAQRNNMSSSSSTWPPFRPLEKIDPAFNGVFRLLKSRILQKTLAFIIYKYVVGESNISESLLISTFHLIQLSLENKYISTSTPPSQVSLHPPSDEQYLLHQVLSFFDNYTVNDAVAETYYYNIKHALMKDGKMTEGSDVMECVHKVFHKTLYSYILKFFEKIEDPQNISKSQYHLQYMKNIIFLLPEKKFLLLKRFVQYWYCETSKSNKCIKEFDFVQQSELVNEPMGDVLMFLFDHFNYLFQVYQPVYGFPTDYFAESFLSPSIIDNMKTALNGKNIVNEQHGGVDFYKKKFARKELVKQFIEVAACTDEVASNHLNWYSDNIEDALTSFISKNIDDSMESYKDITMESQDDSNPFGTMLENTDEKITLLSLLVKLRKLLIARSISTPKKQRSTEAGDGVYYLTKLLNNLALLSNELKTDLMKICPEMIATQQGEDIEKTKSPQDKLKELRRKKAKDLQQKLLSDFASQQQKFLKHAEKSFSMEVCDTDKSCNTIEDIEANECVICGQASKSTEERPIGLIVLLLASTVNGHRLKTTDNQSNNIKWHQLINDRKKEMLKFFDMVSVRSSFECGIDCGINIQSCGHYIHIDCQQSYFKSLQEETQRLLNTDKGEFSCPLCRQLANSVLPIIPNNVITAKSLINKLDGTFTESCNEISTFLTHFKQGGLTRYTARALEFSVLTESLKALAHSIEAITKLCSDDMESFYYGGKWDLKYIFFLMVASLRNNLENLLDIHVYKEKPIIRKTLVSLLESFNFHSQFCSSPMMHRWNELTNGSHNATKMFRDKERSMPTFDDVPILLCDNIQLLLQFIVTWPQKITEGELHHVIQLLYNLTYIQALINIGLSLQPQEKQGWCSNTEKKSRCLNDIASFVWNHTECISQNISLNNQIEITQNVVSPEYVEEQVQQYCLPFLRYANLLVSLISNENIDIPMGASQTEFQGFATKLKLHPTNDVADINSTSFLLWSGDQPYDVIKCWCNSLTSKCPPRQQYSKAILPIALRWNPPSLIKLPKLFESLFQSYRKAKCKMCKKTPEEPTICLVCGEFICFHASCCVKDNVHETVQHSIDCGCGTGVFLVISSSVTLVIREERVCLWGSVYLDAFGEEDKDLRRGKPLYLSEERYRRLEEEWRTHTLDRSVKRWGLHLNRL